MTIVLIFLILYVGMSMWDIGHVNDLLGKMVDPAAHRRAHPAAPVQPAPRLDITLPPAGGPTS